MKKESPKEKFIKALYLISLVLENETGVELKTINYERVCVDTRETKIHEIKLEMN